MPNQKGRKRRLESSKSRLTSENANEANATTGNVLFDNCHNYAANPLTLALNEEAIDVYPTLPFTPLKSLAPKKVMYERSNPDPSAINEIISSVSVLINSRSDNLEIMVKENTLKIEGLKKTIDFICALLELCERGCILGSAGELAPWESILPPFLPSPSPDTSLHPLYHTTTHVGPWGAGGLLHWGAARDILCGLMAACDPILLHNLDTQL
ncbi:hypothetical protein XENORESO_013937 [Xenotaenia resolanae]|uniref:Uncharacterized protein n=1 Tax=Xenotaenia resolanae TaxID=208358 RepID=A0ABV0XB05_9TELE